MAARDYAFDVLNDWGIGDADRDDGVLLLLAVADREVAVEPGSGLDSTLTVAVTDDLLDQVVDDLAADRFGEGMTRLYQLTAEYLAAAVGKRLDVADAAAPDAGYADAGYADAGDAGYGSAAMCAPRRPALRMASACGASSGAWWCCMCSCACSSAAAAARGGGCLKWIFLGGLLERWRRPPRPRFGPRPPRPRFALVLLVLLVRPVRPVRPVRRSGPVRPAGLAGSAGLAAAAPAAAGAARAASAASVAGFGGGGSRGGGGGSRKF